MSSIDATQKFFRPRDVTRVRRNQHRIQFQRLLVVARNFLFVAAIAIAATWMYRHTQSDARFAVKHIEIAGAVHTPRAAIDSITQRYIGLNLFKIDIARVQHDLGSLPWIQRIAIEKKIPDTLRINVLERTPVAIVRDRDGWLDYVDGNGVVLTELSPSIGDDDLPMIADASGSELARTVQFVRDVKGIDAALYSRIGEVAKPLRRRARRAARQVADRIRGPALRRPHRHQTQTPHGHGCRATNEHAGCGDHELNTPLIDPSKTG